MLSLTHCLPRSCLIAPLLVRSCSAARLAAAAGSSMPADMATREGVGGGEGGEAVTAATAADSADLMSTDREGAGTFNRSWQVGGKSAANTARTQAERHSPLSPHINDWSVWWSRVPDHPSRWRAVVPREATSSAPWARFSLSVKTGPRNRHTPRRCCAAAPASPPPPAAGSTRSRH